MGICCLGLSVMCHRGFRVFCADPPFRCIRCSSCGFGCSTGRNVHAEVTGGSGSVMMWLTSRPRAPTASGLLSGYPVVVPQSGDSVTRRRYRVQRSNRRLGSPPLAALFSMLGPLQDRAFPPERPSPSDGSGTGGARLHRAIRAQEVVELGVCPDVHVAGHSPWSGRPSRLIEDPWPLASYVAWRAAPVSRGCRALRGRANGQARP